VKAKPPTLVIGDFMRLVVPGHARGPGFTLIELMVVLALIAIMTAMIIPEMRGTFEDAVLRSSSRELVNVCNLTYSRAVTLNQIHRVHLETSSGKYLIERRSRGGQGVNGFVPVPDLPGGEGRIDSRISIDLRLPGEDSTDAVGDTSAARENSPAPVREETIVFYPDGTADAREILLQDRDGFRIALRINPVTARVNIIELERK
jgi:type II secretion system protein H